LLHHPFDSYECVTGFINQAVADPDVVAIKICLYRTGPDSPIPPALIRASEQGKQVTALIELKARFDEEHNIEWAQKLDYAGVHVVYGIMGLKTHGKLTLVVRREGETLRRYVHVASGNYNPTTSCTYTDLGMFTVDDTIGRDATELFNYLTGFSQQDDYETLMVHRSICVKSSTPCSIARSSINEQAEQRTSSRSSIVLRIFKWSRSFTRLREQA